MISKQRWQRTQELLLKRAFSARSGVCRRSCRRCPGATFGQLVFAVIPLACS